MARLREGHENYSIGTLTRGKKFKTFRFRICYFKNKGLFIILTNWNKLLCIKIKQTLENSRESVCQGQAEFWQKYSTNKPEI